MIDINGESLIFSVTSFDEFSLLVLDINHKSFFHGVSIDETDFDNEIDELIESRLAQKMIEWENKKRGLTKVELVLDSPPYFEDSEPCGYCGREIGKSHATWCRQ